MKKIIYSAVALVFAFFAASCQQENLEPVGGNTVTYTVQVPDALATKADGEGFVAYYEVYRQGDVETPDALPVYEGSEPFENGSAKIELEFVKNQNFVVLFWAQKEGVTAYNTGDLRNVTLGTLTANQDNYEVFAGKDDVSNCESSSNGNVTLDRPIAQLNIATDAEGLKLGNTDVDLISSFVTVKGLSTTYNVYNKDVSETLSDVEFSVAAVPDGKLGTTDYTYVAMNYIGFIDKNGTTVNVDFTVKTSEGDIAHSVSSVPVKPNYKTNIIGNLITATDNYKVTLDDWGTPDTNVEVVAVSTAQDLQEAIENIPPGSEGNIILEGNIDLGTLFGASTLSVTKAGNAQLPIVISAENTVTLDLNGFTITTPWEDENAKKHYYAFNNNGTLNIVDSKANGKIIARGINNYGKMTLESGTIEACDGNGGYGVINYEGAEFVMNGGTVATIYEDGDAPGNGYDATTLRVDEGATATINGGTINNICNFTVAIDNAGTVTINGGTFTSVHTTVANKASMTIEGGSFTCNGLEGITAHALWADAGTTTINGGTFDGKDNYNGFNVDASAGAVVNITGGEFLPVHSGSLYGDGTISVTGGEFFDDPSKRVADGYIVEQENGNYVVYKAVAAIGETMYKSIEDAIAEATAENEVVLLENIQVAENTTIKIEKGKTLNLNLNKKTLSSTNTRTATHNDFINVQGTLNVKDGTITYKHTGDNMAWNGCTNLLDVTAGGVVNMTNVVAENLGGTDMNFAAHLNNWGSVTVNAENCEFLSTYCGFRVFNSGYDVNDVTIKNSKFTGASRAFWVHNYIGDLNSTQHTDAAITARLKLDIYNNGNTFEITGTAVSPIRFGFGNTIYFAENGSPMLHNAASLKWFANEVNERKNSFNGKTVKLVADIDLNNEEWTPIGNSTNQFQGTFDGNNKTISNLVITGNKSDVGLFGMTTNGEIKNLTVNNAKVSGYLDVAVVAGTPYTSKYTNIKVTGHVEVNGFAYVGAVGGKNAYANWTDVTVDVDETSYVNANSVENGTAYRTYVGGVCGFNGEGGHSFKNISSNIDVTGSTIDVGGLFGIAHYGNNFVNCSCSGDVEITAAAEAADAEEIGGIAGVWNNGGADVTFDGCSFTGTLKTNITEGVDLSDNTIVGKAYSASGSGKLIIK